MLLIDIESKSRVDLEEVGGRAYWRHSSTEMLVLAYADPYDPNFRGIWHPGEELPWDPVEPQHLVAHNMMGFDRHGLARYGLLGPQTELSDSSYWAKRMGLAGKLAHSAAELTSIRKDREESSFTKSLSRVRRPPKTSGAEYISPQDWKRLSLEAKLLRGIQAAITPKVMRRVDGYCWSDVKIMVEAFPAWEPWQHIDEEAARLTDEINDRGIMFDADLARGLLNSIAENTHSKTREVARGLGMSPSDVLKIIRSPAQLSKRLGLPNVRKNTIATCEHPLAELRAELTSIVPGKLQAGLARVCLDGALRDVLNYYAAHVGRWGSSGLQLHNLIRPPEALAKMPADQMELLIEQVTSSKHVATKEETDFLLRPLFHARPGHTLIDRDFSGIEARALAWTSGHRKVLDLFASGKDPYRPTAASIFGVPVDAVTDEQRYMGKKIYLAAQYQQSGLGFERTCLRDGVDLSVVGITGEHSVNEWRRQNAPIVRFWKVMLDAFAFAIEGKKSWAGPFEVRPSKDGKHVAVFMPSGRPIVYRNARLVRYSVQVSPTHREVRWGYGYDGRPDHPKKFDIHGRPFDGVYGGLLTQNAMEGLCRDILLDSMIRIDKAGIPILLTVHDQIVAEVRKDEAKDAAREIQEIMTITPEFVKGLPLAVSGYEGERFRK